MEDFIDAEDMLDMLFDKKVNVLTYLPTDLLRNIASFVSEAKDILALHYVSTRLSAVMQEDFTWKKLCLSQKFAFVHDENEWKSYFFVCESQRNLIQKMEYHTVKSNRQLFGGNERWLVQCVTLDEGSTCLEAVASGVATPIQDPSYVGRVLYHKLSKDTLVVGDRRNINLIDLVDGTIYDHILTIFNIDVITYEPHSKQVFAGMDDGIIKCWRSSRAKITVGNMDPRYHTVDRPCITMKGHSKPISALHVSVDCTDANQRLASGAVDGTIVIWQKAYENGHSYRKEHVLEGHAGPIFKLFSHQNLLISTDLISIKIWDQLTGERLHMLTIEQFKKQATINYEEPKNPADLPGTNKTSTNKQDHIDFVSESYGRVAAVSQGCVYVWNIKSGELSSTFSLDLKFLETVNGVLLSSCYLFVITSSLEVHVWNIVYGEHVIKWAINRELMQDASVTLFPHYHLSLTGKGPTSTLLISSENDADSYYFEFRVTPPRFTGFRKRKREQLRS